MTGAITKVLFLAFSLFAINTAARQPLLPLVQNPLFVGIGLFLVFLTVRGYRRGRGLPLYDLLALLTIVGITVYTLRRSNVMLAEMAFPIPWDIVVAYVYLLLILESGRRTLGWGFTSLATLMVLYARFGDRLGGWVGHPGAGWDMIGERLYFGNTGFWSTSLTGAVSTIVPIFIVFGSLFMAVNGEAVLGLARFAGGRLWGGGAQIAVFSSATIGMVQGLAVSNVATTGSFTIPLMKRLGYRPDFAGAVESSASTGGIILPPIMGVGAFIMAELLGMPYVDIIIAAALGGILYYFAIFLGIYYEAKKRGHGPLPKTEIPSARIVLSYSYILPTVLPLAALVWFLVQGWGTMRSAWYATLLLLAIYLLTRRSWEEVRRLFINTYKGLLSAGQGMMLLAVLGPLAAVVVEMISLSGLGLAMSDFVLKPMESLFPVLIAAAFISIILGMGLPAVAAYIVVVGVLAGPLIDMGIEAFPVHMFVYYFSMLSAITPPFAPACFVAVSISGGDMWRTSVIAIRLSIVAYIIPFFFVYAPQTLLRGKPQDIAMIAGALVLGLVALTRVLHGYYPQRAVPLFLSLFLASAILLFIPGATLWNGIGALVLVLALGLERFLGQQRATTQAAPATTEQD